MMEALLNKLTTAISRDNVNAVQNCLNQIRIPVQDLRVGSTNSSIGKHQFPLLHFAAKEGSVKVLQFLIEKKGLHPNQISQPAGTALSRAVHCEQEECVRFLLTTSCDVNIQVPVCQIAECRVSFVTPLMVALSKGNREIVKMLFSSKNIDVNKKTTFGENALYFAIKNTSQSNEYVKMTLDAGVDANVVSMTDLPPLHLAIKLGRFDVAEQLIKAGCDVNIKQETPRSFGFTALHLAAETNDSHLVQLLINSGADLESKCDPSATLGCTPLLHSIAGNKSYQAMFILIKAGADVTATDKFGRGVLHWLVLNRNDNALAYVLANCEQINPDFYAFDGMPTSPMDYAISTNNLPAVKLLLYYNCKISTDRHFSFGAMEPILDEALKRGNCAEIIPYLYKAGCNVSTKMAQGLVEDNGKNVGVHGSIRHNYQFMAWLKKSICKPRTLYELSRLKIRNHLSHNIASEIEELPIPRSVKVFLKDTD